MRHDDNIFILSILQMSLQSIDDKIFKEVICNAREHTDIRIIFLYISHCNQHLVSATISGCTYFSAFISTFDLCRFTGLTRLS